MRSYSRNITALYLIKIAKWFMLFMPIVVLFYKDNGLDMKDIFLLQAIYSVAVVVLEIPSGYVADVWGRRKTLIVGCILGCLGFLCYSFSSGFYGFLLAEIVLGFGQSFISGADSAMLYDTLLELNKDKEYTKYEGRVTAIGNFAETIAGIFGAIIATISLRTPYYFQSVVAFVGIPGAFILIEPKKHIMHAGISLKYFLGIINWCLFKNKSLRNTILFSSIIGTSTLTMAWFALSFFELIKIPLILYSILWPGLNLLVGLTSLVAYKLEQKLGQKVIIVYILLFLSAGYILLGFSATYLGIVFLVVFYLTRGIATPILKHYIHQLTESSIRATVLSVRSFIIRILFAVVGPVLGWITEAYSLGQALIIAGLVLLVSGGIFVILIITNKVTNVESYTSISKPS